MFDNRRTTMKPLELFARGDAKMVKMKVQPFEDPGIKSNKISGLSAIFSGKYSSYVEGYCNIFSVIFVFPYTLTRDEGSGELRLSSSKIKKISCIFLHSTVILGASVYVLALVKPLIVGENDPVMIYHLGCTFAMTAYLCFIELMWRRSEKLLKFANWFIQKNIPPVSMTKVWLLCLIPICITSLFNPPSKSFLIVFGNEDSIENLLLPNMYLNSNAVKGDPEIAVTLRILEYLLAACFRCTHLFFLVGTGIMSAVLFSVNTAVGSYWDKLKKYKMDEYWKFKRVEMLRNGIMLESDIRHLINLTNSMLGPRIFSEYLMIVVFYAFVLMLFSANSTAAERVHATLYSLFSVMFWISASEIRYKVSHITKKWIAKYRNLCLLCSQDVSNRRDENSLLALQIETDTNPAGISCRCFTISYGFLGSMLGLIITYSTIVFQLQSAPSAVAPPTK